MAPPVKSGIMEMTRNLVPPSIVASILSILRKIEVSFVVSSISM